MTMTWVRRCSIAIVLVLLLTGTGLLPMIQEQSAKAASVSASFDSTPAPQDAFQNTWARDDQPVASKTVNRTWMWGPQPDTNLMTESYKEAPGGQRTVQYYDKTRMEITNPNGDPSSIWYVTNGLLAEELITGQMQVGNNTFEPREPAQINIAGDLNDPNGPTYATFNALMKYKAIPAGWKITQQVDRAGHVTTNSSLGSYDVTAQNVGAPTHHDVASVFWAFMNSSGLVDENGKDVQAKLFANPFYATGYPITEAYWTKVKVGGKETEVLVQAFERRVLTYTPSNPSGWKVEAGNVGQHYYIWRYGQAISSSQGGTATFGGNVKVSFPAGAFGQNTTVTIGQLAASATPKAPSTQASLSAAYNINAGGATLNKPATVTMSYNPSLIPSGSTSSDVFAAYYDASVNAWIPVATSVDANNHTVTFQTDHFSWWQVWTWNWDDIAGVVSNVLSLDLPDAFNAVHSFTEACNTNAQNLSVDNSKDNGFIKGCITSFDGSTGQLRVLNLRAFPLAVSSNPSSYLNGGSNLFGDIIQEGQQQAFTVKQNQDYPITISAELNTAAWFSIILDVAGKVLPLPGNLAKIFNMGSTVECAVGKLENLGSAADDMRKIVGSVGGGKDSVISQFKSAILDVGLWESIADTVASCAGSGSPLGQFLENMASSELGSLVKHIAEGTALANLALTVGDLVGALYQGGSATVKFNLKNESSQPAKLSAPSNVTATANSSSSITVNWSYSGSGQTGFKITANGANAQTASASARSYTYTGLQANTKYCFDVQATNASTTSTQAQACATTPRAALTVPTGLTATAASSTEIDLSWSYSGSNPSSFNIYINNSKSGSVAGSDGGAHVTNLQPNTSYCFHVTAVINGSESQPSNQACATTSQAGSPPAAPSNPQVTTPNSTTEVLTWTDNSNNETGFYVSNGNTTVQVGANVTSYTWGGLAPGTYQCMDVSAYNAYGQSSWTSWVCATTPQQTTVPATPTNLQASWGSDVNGPFVTLTWQDSSSDVVSWNIDAMCMNAGCSPTNQWVSMNISASDQLALDVYVENVFDMNPSEIIPVGAEFCFAVQAVGTAGSSSWSSTVCLTVQIG